MISSYFQARNGCFLWSCLLKNVKVRLRHSLSTQPLLSASPVVDANNLNIPPLPSRCIIIQWPDEDQHTILHVSCLNPFFLVCPVNIIPFVFLQRNILPRRLPTPFTIEASPSVIPLHCFATRVFNRNTLNTPWRTWKNPSSPRSLRVSQP